MKSLMLTLSGDDRSTIKCHFPDWCFFVITPNLKIWIIFSSEDHNYTSWLDSISSLRYSSITQSIQIVCSNIHGVICYQLQARNSNQNASMLHNRYNYTKNAYSKNTSNGMSCEWRYPCTSPFYAPHCTKYNCIPHCRVLGDRNAVLHLKKNTGATPAPWNDS